MVFLTAMVSVMLASYLGKGGIVYAFIISICMEVGNLLLMTKAAIRAEKIAKNKFQNTLNHFKQREKELQEAAASLQRSNEALETQSQEYIDRINGYTKQLHEKEKQVAEYKDRVVKQQKIIDAATKPAWE